MHDTMSSMVTSMPESTIGSMIHIIHQGKANAAKPAAGTVLNRIPYPSHNHGCIESYEAPFRQLEPSTNTAQGAAGTRGLIIVCSFLGCLLLLYILLVCVGLCPSCRAERCYFRVSLYRYLPFIIVRSKGSLTQV